MEGRCSAMESSWRPVLVLVLAASLTCSPACADTTFGCLFEDDFCGPYEFCFNDGVFGRCQELTAAQPLNTYDVSSSSLNRLTMLLHKLALRGLTWQDDLTQQVISRELSKLRSVPLGHPASAPLVPYGGAADRKVTPGQAALSRNLQQLLKGVHFLPVQQDTGGTQNEDIAYDEPKTGWKQTGVYSVQKGDQAPVTKVFSHSGQGRHPDDNKALSNHLDQLLGGGLSGPQASWPKGKLRYLSYVRPPPRDQQVAFGSKSPKTNSNHLLFKSVPSQLSGKKHLDDTLQDMLKHFGGHGFNMDTWMTKDLDQLTEVISGALPAADARKIDSGATPGGPGASHSNGVMETNQEQLVAMEPVGSNQGPSGKWDKELKDTLKFRQGQPEDGPDKVPIDKHTAIFSKLLDYLNTDKFGDAPPVKSGPAPGPRPNVVGLESVRSRTMQTQAAAAPHGWEEKSVSAPVGDGSTLRLTSGAAGPDAHVDSEMDRWMQKLQTPAGKKAPEEAAEKDVRVKSQLVHVGVKEFSSRGKDRHFGYIITSSDSLTSDQALDLMERLTQQLDLHASDLTQLTVLGPALTFRVGHNPENVTTADLVQIAVQRKQQLEKETGLKIVEAGVSDRGSLTQIPVVKETRVESGQLVVLSVLCMLFILVALAVSATFFCVRQRSHVYRKEKLSSLGTDTGGDATATYQELCRQRMAIRASERVERPETLRHSRLNSVSSQFSDGPAGSPSTRSSTSSWCEEPVPSNMDISTGHMILSYMEDHLKNKNRLEREWEALCSYQAEPGSCSVALGTKKNRSDAVLPYDHSRITLKAKNNHSGSDYINASPIMDHDPRNPTYIASQGPLPSTVADFWQMVWESGCVVIVMLTPVSENGVKQCHHYWPDEGSDVYHFYEVNLVSEHIWCEDFLVRSFYLKNLQTNETRTVTQFHFLSWTERGVPATARSLLDFRRKVNKCYRGRSCPIIVHCSDGAGRSGTYILIDMVLNRMAKGAKEIDIAATLEHLRDQRASMVHTKEQFEFALTAVAEEVNAILKALPQ
ncbi:receptor-type tyrosine-protein phosphatase N2 isoform X1 [Entelurus aequoreus]|uniref:receptor-type tyrosine-protein phosphatase N2 isoform X1 n=1 Tax=Entelurus aequoreus TaxID=161455 RepID=UPI002B1D2675|nr:receptor-type tyrosine-protein phosphatase N2 isoform X1 [Entelurus aequoreus]